MPADRSAMVAEAPSRSRGGHALLITGLVLAMGAAGALVVTDDLRWLRLGIVAALWAALVGAFLAARYRGRLADRDEHAADLQSIYELELEREIAARREYELQVEAEIRGEVEEKSRQDLAALREEMHTLRQTLQNLLGGEVLVERYALHAQSTRMRALAEERQVRPMKRLTAGTSQPQVVPEPITERFEPLGQAVPPGRPDPLPAPRKQPRPEVVLDSGLDPRSQNRIDPVSQPRMQPRHDPRTPPQPGSESRFDPRSETWMADDRFEPRTESQPDPRSQRRFEPGPAPRPNARSDPPSSSRPDPGAGNRFAPRSDARIDPPSASRLDPGAGNRFDPRSDARIDPPSASRPGPGVDNRFDSRSDARIDPPSQNRLDPRSGNDFEPQPDPRFDPRSESRLDPRFDPRPESRLDPLSESRSDNRGGPPRVQPDPAPPLPRRGDRAERPPWPSAEQGAPVDPPTHLVERPQVVPPRPAETPRPTDPTKIVKQVRSNWEERLFARPAETHPAEVSDRWFMPDSFQQEAPGRHAQANGGQPPSGGRRRRAEPAPAEPESPRRHARAEPESGGGRRRRADGDPSWQEMASWQPEPRGGSHSQGNSVADLLAMHGGQGPRRRRRRED